VLWWAIEGIIAKAKKKPKYLILENVDRLLKSPSKQHGRDFAIMLSSLLKLEYIVEWRVINAADYGMSQKRRRVFILAYHKGTPVYNKAILSPVEFLKSTGVLAQAFPALSHKVRELSISDNEVQMSEEFNIENKRISFENSGIMVGGVVLTAKCDPIKNEPITLGDILDKGEIPTEFFIDEKEESKREEAKGPKRVLRITSEGFNYHYSVGRMSYPDSLNQPARTIVTSEGGSTPSLFKHVVMNPKTKRLRRLTLRELEKINMFPENHTEHSEVTNVKMAFFMGNALVVGVVEKIGIELCKQNSKR
jgi:DNA (cytosine-5)-methyltransferase 1